MSTPVTVNGTVFNVPSQGDAAPWGPDLTDVIVALSNVSNSQQGPSDISLTNFQLTNNQASPTNVVGASFNTSTVRGFFLNYSIYISTSNTEYCETGILQGSYSSIASTWDLVQTYSGSSNVTLSITSAGQIQYVSGNTSGTGYSGKMKFYAKAFLQTP
jgi:hypothetical protein